MTDVVSDAINLAGADVDFSQYRRSLVVLGSSPAPAWYAFGGGAACGPSRASSSGRPRAGS